MANAELGKATYMKSIILTTALLLGLLGFATTSLGAIVVTAKPLWTDTGIIVQPTDIVTINGNYLDTEAWHWGDSAGSDADGYKLTVGEPGYGAYFADEWIQNGQHAQLIGYLDTSAIADLNVLPRAISQYTDTVSHPIGIPGVGVFSIGTGVGVYSNNISNAINTDGNTSGIVTFTGVSGRLWLGINDGYNSGTTNNGDYQTVEITVIDTTVPEPSTLMVFGGLGAVGLVMGWRRRKRTA